MDKPTCVLVADDELNAVILLRRIMEREGFVVDDTRDGESALERAAENDYDLILLDVGLPDDDGVEIAAHLRPLNFGNGSVEISGYAGVPPFSRLDREWQIVFINERPTSSPVVSFAIQSAYRDVLVGGRYAPLFMQVRVPSDAMLSKRKAPVPST